MTARAALKHITQSIQSSFSFSAGTACLSSISLRALCFLIQSTTTTFDQLPCLPACLSIHSIHVGWRFRFVGDWVSGSSCGTATTGWGRRGDGDGDQREGVLLYYISIIMNDDDVVSSFVRICDVGYILTWHGMLCRHFGFNGSRQPTTSGVQLSSGQVHDTIRFEQSNNNWGGDPTHLGHKWNGMEAGVLMASGMVELVNSCYSIYNIQTWSGIRFG